MTNLKCWFIGHRWEVEGSGYVFPSRRRCSRCNKGQWLKYVNTTNIVQLIIANDGWKDD